MENIKTCKCYFLFNYWSIKDNNFDKQTKKRFSCKFHSKLVIYCKKKLCQMTETFVHGLPGMPNRLWNSDLLIQWYSPSAKDIIFLNYLTDFNNSYVFYASKFHKQRLGRFQIQLFL